ncbi:uncharacterized protein LOC144569213 [Carex rostrata]
MPHGHVGGKQDGEQFSMMKQEVSRSWLSTSCPHAHEASINRNDLRNHQNPDLVQQVFNTALLEKLVWQLGAIQDRLWIEIFKAKYYPDTSLWEAEATRILSSLWKALQEYRAGVAQRVKWEIGDGMKIEVWRQPWFEGWDDQIVPAQMHVTMKIADLYNFQSRQWNCARVEELFGTHNESDNSVSETSGIEENLELESNTQSEIWNWNWKGVIHSGLTTTLELSKRFLRMQPSCPRCQQENEFMVHLLFFGELSRATWFLSPPQLRVEGLPLIFSDVILFIAENLEPKQITLFCNILWELWKARNEELFQAKKSTPQGVLARANN